MRRSEVIKIILSFTFSATTPLFRPVLKFVHGDFFTVLVYYFEILFVLHDELSWHHNGRHSLNRLWFAGFFLFLKHARLHASPLLLDLVSLLNDHILASDIRVSGLEPYDWVELLVVVLFMQIHSVRKHLLNVADFYWHVRTQHTAVYLNASRVRVIKRPNKKVLNYVVEAAAGLKVKWLVFLNWNYWQAK